MIEASVGLRVHCFDSITRGQKRLADAARRRWAAMRAAEKTAKLAVAKRRKRRLTPEGRRRIIAATKRRWAAVRAANATP